MFDSFDISVIISIISLIVVIFAMIIELFNYRLSYIKD